MTDDLFQETVAELRRVSVERDEAQDLVRQYDKEVSAYLNGKHFDFLKLTTPSYVRGRGEAHD